MENRNPEESCSEEELLKRLAKEVQNEDVQANLIPLPAFEHVVGKYAKELYSFAWNFVKRREDAEDITQSVFFNAHKAIKKYTPERILNLSLRAWLYRITYNAAMRFLRVEKRKLGEISIDDLDPLALDQLHRKYSVDVETQAEQHEKFEACLRAFNTLSENKRITFYLRVGRGLKYREISKILNTRVGTIKARMSRARVELQGMLGSDYSEYFDWQDDEEGE